MNFKYPLFSSLLLSLILSGSAFAKKPEGKGKHHQGPGKEYRHNSNKQSDEFSLRGKDRAEERHQYKKSKKHKKNKEKYRDDRYERAPDRNGYRRNDDSYERNHDRNEYYRKDDSYRDRDNREMDRYERQRYQERYQNDPVGIIVDETANNVRSKVNQVHRKVIDSIDNKTRSLSGERTQKEDVRENKPWWSIFGRE